MVSQLNYRKYSQSLHQCLETTLPGYHGTVKRFTYLQNSTLGLHSRALSILKDSLCNPSVLEGGKVNTPLLLSGLMYREICCAMEMEPDAPTGAPESLINSPFGIKELKEIEAVLDNVVIDATDA